LKGNPIKEIWEGQGRQKIIFDSLKIGTVLLYKKAASTTPLLLLEN